MVADEKPKYDPEGRPAGAMTLDEAINRLWSKVGGLAVNLGSGDCPSDGWVNVDIRPDAVGVNVVCDIFRDPWPFPDNSVGMIYSSHFMEHVPSECWTHVWNESWRVIKDGGHVVTLAPYYTSSRFAQDHTHVQPIHEDKWSYLSKEWRVHNGVKHSGFVDDLNFIMDTDPWYQWNAAFRYVSAERQEFARKHYNNAVDDVILFACAVKSPDTINELVGKLGTTL